MYDVPEDRPTAPRRPERAESEQSRSSFLPVLFVAVPLVTMIVGLVAFTGRAGLLMVLAVGSVPGFILLHYLLWGRWLARRLRQQAEADRDDKGK